MGDPIPKDAYQEEMSRDVVARLELRDASILRPGDLRANSALELLAKKNEERVYTIDGKTYTRNQCMEYIVANMTDARFPMSKVEICRVKGAPTLREVAAWERAYPTFKDELRDAERIRAELLAWQSVEVTMAEDDPKAGTLIKAKAEALRWMASKLDTQKFADRKIEQHEDALGTASTQELIDILKNAVMSNRELLKELTHEERQQLRETGFMDADIVESTPEDAMVAHGETGGSAVHPDHPQG